MSFIYGQVCRSSGLQPDAGVADDMAERAASFVTDINNYSTLQLSVRRARSLRDLRKKMLGDECFSGPAWDILLHLFESHLLQRRDTIGNVCDGAGIPATTAIRWLGRLEDNGMIMLSNDHLDHRRRLVALSNSGVEMLTRYFAGISPHLMAA